MHTLAPLREYGIIAVSRPMAAALLGVSLKTLNRKLEHGQLRATGRVQKVIRVGDIERLTGQPVAADDFLRALGRQKTNALAA